ncbi:MAG TPA: diaminopimelate epimerase [Pyrinomonadaceae bacterium]|nr:diaminopimelate epimerase [Pyrinomonadaceae bacterium]
MPIHFIKFHGLGNDYLVIEPKDLNEVDDLGEFARRICNRHYGAGGDGIAVVSKSETDIADYRVRIFNPDGSEAGLSGNGTRCAAAYLYFKNMWSGPQLRLITRSGLKRYLLKQKLGAGKYVFESELGQPRFDTRSIPMAITPPLEKVVDYPVNVNGGTYAITALQIGNPVICIFVDDFDAFDWRHVGKVLETHQLFPERTNVVFAYVHDQKTLELRIWERGVGETTASGTCSCAGAVAAMVKEKTDRKVTVVMPGGEVKIEWRDDSEVVITGTAEVVYSGQWLA